MLFLHLLFLVTLCYSQDLDSIMNEINEATTGVDDAAVTYEATTNAIDSTNYGFTDTTESPGLTQSEDQSASDSRRKRDVGASRDLKPNFDDSFMAKWLRNL